MISVIIPVFNVEKYLSQCIESLLNQTYQHFEIILIDDGSTDSSGFICDEYAKLHKKIHVVHQYNSGVSAARNLGLRIANGDWVSFVDPDDYVNSDYLERFDVGKEDVDIITQGLAFIDNRTGDCFRNICFPDALLSEENIKSFVCKYDFLSFGGCMCRAIRKRIIDMYNIRFNESIAYHEDHVFIFNLLNVVSRIKLCSAVSYNYRCYHSQYSLSNKSHSWEKLVISSDMMIGSINTMAEKYFEKGSEYSKKIYTLVYSPKISAIYELQRTKVTYGERKILYREIIKKEELVAYYHPKSSKDVLLKSIMIFLPFFIVDYVLKLFLMYQNVHILRK